MAGVVALFCPKGIELAMKRMNRCSGMGGKRELNGQAKRFKTRNPGTVNLFRKAPLTAGENAGIIWPPGWSDLTRRWPNGEN